MAKYTVEQRLSRCTMALMGHKKWCALSGVMLMGKLTVSDTVPTARTNGRDEIYGRAFVETLTDPELRFLRLHETMHKGLRHLTIYAFLKEENPRLANQAMDYVINISLVDTDDGEGFIVMPKCGWFDAKYRGWHTKQVYDDLKKNGQGQMSTSEEGTSDGFDEHDFDGAESLSESEKEALKKDVEAAIRQGGILAGAMKGDKNRALEDVLESQIRWQEILAEFVKNVTKGRDNASWAKVNRRWVASGMYLPSSVSESVGKLLVGIDASGSTWSGNQLEGFVGELIAIANDCTPESIDVVWWDTEVQSVQSYKPEDYAGMKLNLQIQGGGGTRPSCVTDWIQKDGAGAQRDYVAAIMLSDGLVGSDWGNWDACGAEGTLPVLWCLNQKGITAGVGQTVYIEETN